MWCGASGWEGRCGKVKLVFSPFSRRLFLGFLLHREPGPCIFTPECECSFVRGWWSNRGFCG